MHTSNFNFVVFLNIAQKKIDITRKTSNSVTQRISTGLTHVVKSLRKTKLIKLLFFVLSMDTDNYYIQNNRHIIINDKTVFSG